MSLKSHALYHSSIIIVFSCIQMCAICLCVIGLDWAKPMMQFVLYVTCSCISHAYILYFSIYQLYLNYFGAFLIVSFFPLSILFTLVVSMAPKRKSTPAWNPLHSGASSSSDSAPLSLWFRDNDAHKAFLEKFSRRGVHSECQVILADFVDINLPTVIHSREWESLCDVPVTYPLVLIEEFYSNMHGIIVQYLSSLLAFEVHAFLSHRNLLRICFGFLGQSFLTILVVSICGLCPRMSSWLISVSALLIGVIISLHYVGLLLKVLDSETW